MGVGRRWDHSRSLLERLSGRLTEPLYGSDNILR